MSLINVGLVGFGLSGRVFHGPFIMNAPNMNLHSVCSRQPDAVQALSSTTKVVSDFESMIDDDHIDLMVITTPNALHFTQAKAALKAGKHVLLEKPSVTKLTQIETLCQLAEAQGLVFCVYQNRRFDGDFRRLQQLIKTAELGPLKFLESRFDRFRPQVNSRWRELPGEGTGIFWDLAPHLLDQILVLLGPPQWLQASMGALREGAETVDWFDIELGYAQQRIRVGSNPFIAGKTQRFQAGFQQGYWGCQGLDPQEEALRSGQMPWDTAFPDKGQPQTVTTYQVSGALNEVTPSSEYLDYGHYGLFYQQLAGAILEKNQAPVSMLNACELIYTLKLAEQSASLGAKVTWSYQSPLGVFAMK